MLLHRVSSNGANAGAQFASDLQTSLVPRSSGGSATPTYTRAATAYVEQYDGLRTLVLSGEARMQGARRVQNYIAASEADWTKGAGVVTTNLGGGVWEVDLSAAANGVGVIIQGTNPTGVSAVGTVYLMVSAASGDNKVDVSEPAAGAFATFTPTLTTSFLRYATPVFSGATTAYGFWIKKRASGATLFRLKFPQMENVTGQANQNPSEYVSIGVLSAPYHGVGIDGIKAFSTLNGNTVASNVVTEATGAAIVAGAAGVAATAPVDAGGPFGYLSEGSRENLALQSQTFATTWVNASGLAVPTENTTVAPDGTTTADTLTAVAGVGAHQISQGITHAASTYTFSVYVKAGTASWISLTWGNAPIAEGAYFNLGTGVVGTVNGAGMSSTIAPALNGFYRCTFTGTAGANFVAINIQTADNQAATWNAAGTETVIVWGAQDELGSFASSYIPTTTVAVTKAASVDQYVSASNIASTMTIDMDWTPEAAAMGTVFLFGTYVDASNYTAILHDGTNMIARKRIGGANHDATKALTYAANTVYRISARFDATNGVDIFVAGVKGTTDATLTASQIGTNFQVGADGNSLQQAFGAIREFRVYPTSLSDSRIAAL